MYRPQYLEEPESTYEKYWSHNGYLPEDQQEHVLEVFSRWAQEREDQQ